MRSYCIKINVAVILQNMDDATHYVRTTYASKKKIMTHMFTRISIY